MNLLKKTISTLILLFAANAYAEGTSNTPFGHGYENREERISKFKERGLQNNQKRINILQQTENCISNSATKDEFRQCKEKEHDSTKSLREQSKRDMENKREQFRQNMQEKREQHKTKMQ